MSVQEWWWLYDAQVEQNEAIEGIKSKNGPHAKFSGPEWDEARKRHKEKMNGKPSAP